MSHAHKMCRKMRAYTENLTPTFTQIFYSSWRFVKWRFKNSTIIPVPKTKRTTELNDHRPVTLTSVNMKSFEKLLLYYLRDIRGPLLESLQTNMFECDVVNTGLHYIPHHLKTPGTNITLITLGL